MHSNKSQPMEKVIDGHCQRLLHDIISFTILDLFACFIFFIIMRWMENILENRFLFLPTLLLQFLLSYLLDKLCPKYITLILSYIYNSVCKSILPKSILKIDFSLVTRNRGMIVFGISACFVISTSFLLEPSVLYYYCLKNLAFFGFFVPHPAVTLCPVETLLENSINCSRREDEIDIKDMKLTRDDLKTVIKIFCQFSNYEVEEIGDYMMCYQEFCALFEDSEPSLDEVREAFSIFDQDRDGFFDARDLHVVLINLGLEGGDMDLNTCQNMIEQYDSGGGGKISSTDFCRLLETSLL